MPLPGPGRMSFRRTGSPGMPPVTQSSVPSSPVVAWKTALPFTSTKPAGDEAPPPRLRDSSAEAAPRSDQRPGAFRLSHDALGAELLQNRQRAPLGEIGHDPGRIGVRV